MRIQDLLFAIAFFGAFAGGFSALFCRCLFVAELKMTPALHRELGSPGYVGQNFLITGPWQVFSRLSDHGKKFYLAYLTSWCISLVGMAITLFIAVGRRA